MKSKVYFTKDLSTAGLMRVFEALGADLSGKVAVKVHSGEKGNQNFLRPEYFRDIINKVNGTVVECNTAYAGQRNTTEKHQQLIKEHGWTEYFDVDIMDAEGDMEIPVNKGSILSVDVVGSHLSNYDSMLVLSHFKGHPMGGFGVALKQLSIGCASSAGKTLIHTAGKANDQSKLWDNVAKQDDFLDCMAETAGAVVDFFGRKMAFVNVMCNMSVDCDCCAKAEDPCLCDVGILASLDPVAIDKACIDIVYNSDDEGKAHFIERVESRNGLRTIQTAESLGVGSTDYELINID